MQSRKAFTGLLIAFLVLGSANLVRAQQSVIYGSNAEEGRYPWMATLTTVGSGRNSCGATLINERWVMTAAHCTYNLDTAEFQVILNPYTRSNPQPYADTINVDKVVVHPKGFGSARDSTYADIALLRLEHPITTTPIQLAVPGNASWYELDSFPAQVLGWGFVDTLFNGNDTLQLGRPVIISKPRCLDLYSSVSTPLKDWEVCAGFLDASQPQGAAFGDSGGPLLVERNGELLQVGIVARGSGAFTSKRRPGIFTQVEEFTSWIDSITSSIVVPVQDAQSLVPTVEMQFSHRDVHLSWNRKAQYPRQVIISDFLGRVVLSKTITPTTKFTQLPVTELAPGPYVVIVYEDGIRISQPWIKT